jgi:hypothetical protein
MRESYGVGTKGVDIGLVDRITCPGRRPLSLSLRPPWTSPLQSRIEVLAQLLDQHTKQLPKLLAISVSLFHISCIENISSAIPN